jgi:hypothetical protein
MAILVVVVAVAAFWIAARLGSDNAELSKNLQNAALTLIYGALLGGVAKILLDDFDRRRQQRADHAQFIANVFADLKAVYDRVERARILLPAHQSALTFGNEMRDIIEARVKLLNVIRALDRDRFSSSEELKKHVNSMQNYLQALIRAFQRDYKRIADLQKRYESQVKAILEQLGRSANSETITFPSNEPWEELCKLEEVRQFIEPSLSCGEPQAARDVKPADHPSRYDTNFVGSLNEASRILRDELRNALAT